MFAIIAIAYLLPTAKIVKKIVKIIVKIIVRIFYLSLLSYCLGYFCKNSGVSIPGLGTVDLWRILVKNEPQARNH